METELLDIPPSQPGRKIDKIWIWIGVHADGSETILSADLNMDMPGGGTGRRHMPLMNSRRESAELATELARRIQRETMHRSDRFISVALRCYRLAA